MQEMARTEMSMGKQGLWKLADAPGAVPPAAPEMKPPKPKVYKPAEEAFPTGVSFGEKSVPLPKGKLWVETRRGRPVKRKDGSYAFYTQGGTPEAPSYTELGPDNTSLYRFLAESDVDLPADIADEKAKPYVQYQKNYRGWKPYIGMVGEGKPFGNRDVDYTTTAAPRFVMTPKNGPSLVAKFGDENITLSPEQVAQYARTNPDFLTSTPYVTETVNQGTHGLATTGNIKRRWTPNDGRWTQAYELTDGTIITENNGKLYDDKGNQIILGSTYGITPYGKEGTTTWGMSPRQTGWMRVGDKTVAVDLVSGRIIPDAEAFRALGEARGTMDKDTEYGSYSAPNKASNPSGLTTAFVYATPITGTDNVQVVRATLQKDGTIQARKEDDPGSGGHPRIMSLSDFESIYGKGAANGGLWPVAQQHTGVFGMTNDNPIVSVRMNEGEGEPRYTLIDASGNEYKAPSGQPTFMRNMKGLFNAKSYSSDGLVPDGKGGYARKTGYFDKDGVWRTSLQPVSFDAYGEPVSSVTSGSAESATSEASEDSPSEDSTDNTAFWENVWHYVALGLPIGAAIGLVMHMMGGKDSSLIANLIGGAAGGALLGGIGAGTGILKPSTGTTVANTGSTEDKEEDA